MVSGKLTTKYDIKKSIDCTYDAQFCGERSLNIMPSVRISSNTSFQMSKCLGNKLPTRWGTVQLLFSGSIFHALSKLGSVTKLAGVSFKMKIILVIGC